MAVRNNSRSVAHQLNEAGVLKVRARKWLVLIGSGKEHLTVTDGRGYMARVRSRCGNDSTPIFSAKGHVDTAEI